MHRLIVTSATYRQSSTTSPELLARDPRNILLARGPRFRIEAEMVRDLALAASGLLTEKVGGPSVYPPQPEGVTALAYGGGGWPTSGGPERYRRGLYTFTKRTAPYAAFATFDAPSSELACVRRERSNTPLQALTLLNDAVFVEAARALAKRSLEAADTTEGRIRYAFRACLARAPREDEAKALAAFLDAQLARFRAGESDAAKVAGVEPKAGVDAAELAAWTTLAPRPPEPRRDDQPRISRRFPREPPPMPADPLANAALRASTRRHFFRDCGVGVGKIALASLLVGRESRAAPSSIRWRRGRRTSPRRRSG